MEQNQTQPKSKGGIFNNFIVRTLIKIVLSILAVVLVSGLLLNLLTNHGKHIEVPDLTNMSYSQAYALAKEKGLRVDVVDSVYIRRMKKGAVFTQNPKAGANVKKGRRIQLTINSVHSKKLSMPNLIGLSVRQANAELSAKGLNLGKLIYVNDIATNNVIKQLYNNREIRAGRNINSDSDIDLVVGLNDSDNLTFVPDVVGLRYKRAVSAVHENSLNIKKLIFDRSVRTYTDSLDAVVYKQNPPASKTESFTMGSSVTLYLSVDSLKISGAGK